MQPIDLTTAEKEELTQWLSKRSRSVGWFLIGMAGFIGSLGIWGVVQPTSQVGVADLGPFSLIIISLAGPGIWQLNQRRVVRRWLDEPLDIINGRILSIDTLPYSTKRLKLEILHEGETYRTGMTYIGQTDWQVGDGIPLLLWPNGRFCPRHINHLVDVGYLPTPKRQRRRRRRLIIWGVAWFVLMMLVLTATLNTTP